MFSRLTPKQRRSAGNKYEYFIAWKLRNNGWTVEVRSKYGKYDRGIDLVATKNGITRYIQCKGWSLKNNNVVHEDVIDQLYGSAAYHAGPENILQTEVCLYTSSQPTPYAQHHADKLHIQIIYEPYANWNRKK